MLRCGLITKINERNGNEENLFIHTNCFAKFKLQHKCAG